MRIPKKNTITILAGTAILLTGIGLIALTDLDQKIIESGIVTMGMVMIVIGFLNSLKKKQGVAKDELTRKIADRAAAYSWVLTLLALLAVYWLHHFDVVAFTVQGVIGLTYVVMVATMILFQRRFWKRGDVE